MSMRRRNPFEEVEQFIERMSRQLEEGDWSMMGGTSMSVDVAESDDEFVVAADLPGYERDEIDLKISDGTLRIAADHEEAIDEEDETDGRRYIRQERRHQSTSRSIRLPESVEEDEATANYKNGVLTITLPKTVAGDEGSQIEIE